MTPAPMTTAEAVATDLPKCTECQERTAQNKKRGMCHRCVARLSRQPKYRRHSDPVPTHCQKCGKPEILFKREGLCRLCYLHRIKPPKYRAHSDPVPSSCVKCGSAEVTFKRGGLCATCRYRELYPLKGRTEGVIRSLADDIAAQVARGVTQTKIAKELGVSRQRISQILLAKGLPSKRPNLARQKVAPEARAARLEASAERRFIEHVEFSSGCWEWQGCKFIPNRKYPHVQYGKLGRHGKHGYAHRAAYELFKGPIPEGMTVDHICFNTLCVNPDHLQLLTPGQNAARKKRLFFHEAQELAA
jgi:hypothetical protein